jgi:hypothetical protein
MLVGTTFWAVGARGEEPSRPAPGTGATSSTADDAKALVKQANHLYTSGRFAEALSLYLRAYDLASNPKLLFNMAQCERFLGHREKALFLYRRFLREYPNPPNAALVQQVIADLEREEAAAKAPEGASREPKEGTARPSVLPAVPVAEASAPAPRPVPSETDTSAGRPWYRRWYVWAAVGAVVVGGAVGGAVAGTRGSSMAAGSPPSGLPLFGSQPYFGGR